MTTTATMPEILCPSCWTRTIPAVSWEFSQTSVEVPVCESCQATGLVSIKLRVSEMVKLELETYTVHHRQGFVELGHKGRSWTAR